METKSDVMTRAEAAGYLRVSLPTLDKLANTGELRRVKLGTRVLYRLKDLDDFLEAHSEGGVR